MRMTVHRREGGWYASSGAQIFGPFATEEMAKSIATCDHCAQMMQEHAGFSDGLGTYCSQRCADIVSDDRAKASRREAAALTVTEDHLRLLQQVTIRWDHAEFGAPGIDPKRPYGNSNVYGDMAEILGLGPCNEDLEYSDEDERRMDLLHADLEPCLAILCQHGRIEAGPYCRVDYRKWKRGEVPQ